MADFSPDSNYQLRVNTLWGSKVNTVTHAQPQSIRWAFYARIRNEQWLLIKWLILMLFNDTFSSSEIWYYHKRRKVRIWNELVMTYLKVRTEENHKKKFVKRAITMGQSLNVSSSEHKFKVLLVHHSVCWKDINEISEQVQKEGKEKWNIYVLCCYIFKMRKTCIIVVIGSDTKTTVPTTCFDID